MPDREKVIRGLERCSKHDGSECPQCPYFNSECTDDLMADALSLLKEQSELLRKLQKDKDKLCLEVSEWKHKYHDRPLKEQEAKTQGADSGMCEIFSFYERAMPVKPVLDEQTGRIWLCGKCGSFVGFEDNDPYDPNEFDKFCRECGRPVLWESR